MENKRDTPTTNVGYTTIKLTNDKQVSHTQHYKLLHEIICGPSLDCETEHVDLCITVLNVLFECYLISEF